MEIGEILVTPSGIRIWNGTAYQAADPEAYPYLVGLEYGRYKVEGVVLYRHAGAGEWYAVKEI